MNLKPPSHDCRGDDVLCDDRTRLGREVLRDFVEYVRQTVRQHALIQHYAPRRLVLVTVAIDAVTQSHMHRHAPSSCSN